METIKKLWRAYRLAFDPGYPLLTEFLPSIFEETIKERILKNNKTWKKLSKNNS